MTYTLQSVAQQYGISIAELQKLNPGVSITEQFNSINDIKMPDNWYVENGYNMTDKIQLSDPQIDERINEATSSRTQKLRQMESSSRKITEQEWEAAKSEWSKGNYKGALAHGVRAFFGRIATGYQVMAANDSQALDEQKFNEEYNKKQSNKVLPR